MTSATVRDPLTDQGALSAPSYPRGIGPH